LSVKIQAPEGYSLEYHAVLFQRYLFTEALIDCEREEVISALNVDYHEQVDRYQIFFFDRSVKIPLFYSHGFYRSETVLLYLPAGLRTVTVWVSRTLCPSFLSSGQPCPTLSFRGRFHCSKISVLSQKRELITRRRLFQTLLTKPSSWLGYSLDNQDNITIKGNFPLNGLSNGLHKMLIYANDTAGKMGAPETIAFTVEALSAILITALIVSVSVVVISVGLLFYFKKCKR
jgi:hypothetical protein